MLAGWACRDGVPRAILRVRCRSHATKGPAMTASETERVRAIQDKQAPKYDRQISFFERILFGDGRAWVCSQAHGRVLELACGTARNLPFYGDDVELTAIERSEERRVGKE